MRFLDLFIIVILICTGMFAMIFVGQTAINTPPGNITDTFGNSAANAATNHSYNTVVNITAQETQGSGALLIVYAACGILILIMAFIVIASGQYSKNKYRT